jgi:2-dehydropantoate 2-reductase
MHEAGGGATLLVRPERQGQLIGGRTKITSPFGRFGAPLKAVTAPAVAGPFEVVMLATRADQLEAALRLVDAMIGDDTIIVPLIDGLQHLDRWREDFPLNPVIGAVFEARATMDADGVIRQSGPVGRLHLGRLDGVQDERVSALAAMLDGRRFSSNVEDDAEVMMRRIWARHVPHVPAPTCMVGDPDRRRHAAPDQVHCRLPEPAGQRDHARGTGRHH